MGRQYYKLVVYVAEGEEREKTRGEQEEATAK